MKRFTTAIKVLLLFIILFSTTFEVRASIFDDILLNLGLETKAEQEMDNYNKDNIVKEEELDENQKEVVAKVKDIYLDITNMNIDGLIGDIDYKVPSAVETNVKEFFNDYENAKGALTPILNVIDYKIEDVKYVGEDLIAKVNIDYPKMDELVKKIIPALVFNNPDLFLGRKIDNDILISALELIRNEIVAGDFSKSVVTYDFKFKKVGGEWKLSDMNDLIDNITNYINEIQKSVLK